MGGKASYRMMRWVLLGVAMAASNGAAGHGTARWNTADGDRSIAFPDTASYVTLVADLHTHSVFSDGHVWPNIRVAEAQRDGLDVLAITEHLEYQPHRLLLPNRDRNTAFEEALAAAAGTQLIVVRGSEITREAPAGHINAVFLHDTNKILPIAEGSSLAAAVEAWPVERAVAEANEQGAFVFWNHPWHSPATPDLRTKLTDLHKSLIRKGQLHGIEIVNGGNYNEEAHRIALANDLAFIGSSDVHDLIDWDYEVNRGGHRPITLILATERSPKAVRDALFAKRTLVWSENLLIGRPRELDEVLTAALTIEKAAYRDDLDVVVVKLVNDSAMALDLRHVSTKDQSFNRFADIIKVGAHSAIELTVKPKSKLKEVVIEFEVLSAITEPNEHPRLVLRHAVTPRDELGTSFRYEGRPAFTIEFPQGTTKVATDAPEQVFAARTPAGVTFQAAVVDLPEGLRLEQAVGEYVERNKSRGVGKDYEVTANRQIVLTDGTVAYHAELQWFYLPAGVKLLTQVVTAGRDGRLVQITAHPLSAPEQVAPIVESLRFD